MEPDKAFWTKLCATLADRGNEANPLFAELQVLFGHYQGLVKRLDKISRISDGIQAEMRELKDNYERQSVTDHLTGLPNRRYATQRMEEEISRFARYGDAFSVLIADLDNFKKVNDSHGHQCGDEVLCRTAALLRGNIRSVDIISRWGGEEFLLIMPQSDIDAALRTAEKLRVIVGKTSYQHATMRFGVTVSFGATQCRQGDSMDSILTRADHALYCAKEGGRDRVCRL